MGWGLCFKFSQMRTRTPVACYIYEVCWELLHVSKIKYQVYWEMEKVLVLSNVCFFRSKAEEALRKRLLRKKGLIIFKLFERPFYPTFWKQTFSFIIMLFNIRYFVFVHAHVRVCMNAYMRICVLHLSMNGFVVVFSSFGIV